MLGIRCATGANPASCWPMCRGWAGTRRRRRGRDCIRRGAPTTRSCGSRTRTRSRRVRRFDSSSGQDSVELGDQRFLGTAKKIVHNLPQCLGACFVRRQVSAIRIGATDFAALNHALACEAIHDRHDRCISARAALGEAISNFAHRCFAHRPERIHTVEFERREIENRTARRMCF